MKMLSLLAAVMLSLCSVPCVTFAATLDFGDDTSGQAHNGKCDDPRFSGPGSAAVLIEQNAYRDASDCRDLYQRGQIQTANGKSARSTPGAVNAKSRSFGDDASRWARNGECDDPRFSGPGAAGGGVEDVRFHDASDCRALYRRGLVYLTQEPSTMAPLPLHSGETQQGQLPGNGYVDRYLYQGSAGELVTFDLASSDFEPYLATVGLRFSHYWHGEYDSTTRSYIDHSRLKFRLSKTWAGEEEYLQVEVAAFDTTQKGAYTLTANSVSRASLLTRITLDGIDFGDDDGHSILGDRVFDGKCNDPRFNGPGSAEKWLRNDRFHDATDCSELYQSGQVQLVEDTRGAALLLQNGQTLRGQLASSAYPDRYRYQGGAGTMILVEVQGAALTVVTPSGKRLDEGDSSVDLGGSKPSTLALTLTETGEYQVEVAENYTTDDGKYVLKLNPLTVVADNDYEGALDSTDAVLDKGEYVDTYTFDGQSGQFVRIELGSDAFYPFLAFINPDGTQATARDGVECFDDGCQANRYRYNGLLEWELSASGTYTVRVTSSRAGETGTYHLRIMQSEVSQ